MTINSYIKQFGKFTIDQRPLGPVDFLILCELSMMSFDTLLNDKGTLKLKDLDPENIPPIVVEDSPDRKLNIRQLKEMILSKRFRNLEVKNIRRIFSEEKVNQFYAITIVLPNGDLYISYRGTDITLIGWKEDFFIAHQDTFLAQEQAVEYLKEVIVKEKGNFYVGGHSKGGNVALYACFHLTEEESKRLIAAHSFDGPGMRKSINELPAYEYVIDKMTKYRTYNNVIGSIYNQFEKYKVVHSTGLLFGGHDVYYWQVNPLTGDFLYARDVSASSKKYSERFMLWVESLPMEDRILAYETLFDVFGDCNDVYDLPKNGPKDLLKIKKSLKKYPEEDQKKLKEIFKTLLKYLFNFNKINNK